MTLRDQSDARPAGPYEGWTSAELAREMHALSVLLWNSLAADVHDPEFPEREQLEEMQRALKRWATT